MNISLADFSHKTELTELWAEAFGDGKQFITSFLDAYMIPEYNVPVIISNDGRIASALYLINFELYSNTKIMGNCAYLFAAATKKEYRNKGCMSTLVEYAAGLCRNRGLKAVFLFPQDGDEKMFEFYSKFGFKSIYGAEKIKIASGASGTKRDLTGFRLENKDITDVNVFDGLYNSYREYTAKQELAPLKDRLFYFKCAASYLKEDSNVTENSEIKPYFAVFENNVEKFCYVFYKKYKNNYYIDDIIIPEYRNIKDTSEKKYGETADILAEFILNSGDNIKLEMNVPAAPQPSLSGNRIMPMAMLMPLSENIKNITGNLKCPVYINMFMNL